jgi:hypothetical protein
LLKELELVTESGRVGGNKKNLSQAHANTIHNHVFIFNQAQIEWSDYVGTIEAKRRYSDWMQCAVCAEVTDGMNNIRYTLTTEAMLSLHTFKRSL